jgi:hypothetical protein
MGNRDTYTPPPRVPMPDNGRQETANAGVDVLTQVDQSLANEIHVDNGALAAYHTTFERNDDGRTRAVVRLYEIGEPPSGGDAQTRAFYGEPDSDGTWKLTPVKPAPSPPGITMGPR